MYRVVLFLALCGLLAQAAVPSRDASLIDSADNPFNSQTSVDQPSRTGSLWSWFSDGFNYLRGLFWEQEAPKYRPFPPYQELCDPQVSFGYQARSYPKSVWVGLNMTGRFSDVAVLLARPKLEEYFNGKNSRNMTITMTSPLRLKTPRSSGQWGPGYEEKTLIYSMYLPPQLHDNPPEPTDPDMFIIEEEPERYFVITFPSYTYAFLDFQKRNELEDLLNGQREEFLREFFFVDVYNTQTEVTGRQNEVLLLFNPDVQKPNCAPLQKTALPSIPVVPVPEALINNASDPGFTQLCTGAEYDARQYDRAVWVSVTINAISSDVGKFDAFPKLDHYIKGHNDQGVKIEKTLPVRITQEWPKSPYAYNIYRDYTYAYYLPPELYKGIPQPLDPAVRILDEPSAVMFALNYTGFSFEFRDEQMLQKLQNLLIDAGELYMSSRRWARNQYYPSYQVTDCRNDILVYMDPLAKSPRCASACEHRGKECPSYRVLQSLTDDIQRRHISGNLYVLRRTNTCNMTTAYNVAYMPLHRYFRGANNRNESIARPTPVILVHKSTDNPPQGCDFSYNLMFYLPSEKHQNAPEPTEEGVELFRLEARDTFVITFEESSTEEVVDTKLARMKGELDRLELCYARDEFAVATYDAPWRPQPHRHEIWIPQATCARPRPEGSPQYSIQGSGCDVGTECPTYEIVRSYSTFEERLYQRNLWVCKVTTNCNIEDAFNEAITPLYEYYQSCYDVEPKARPVMSSMSLLDFLSTECNKVIETCAFLPEIGRSLPEQPDNDLILHYYPSESSESQATVYMTALQGPPSVELIQSGITTLLRDVTDADLLHNNKVFVARYTLPWEDDDAKTEVGVQAETLAHQL
ncbi:uncharacterized protein LOC119734374 isoform X2 [Patiria miniata]|uniref:Uncharacterized protein n=1 Tax=Patiria miniata TaxID=46514 RepID=A0A914AJR3_PATMI|nr:uncharacterized protein LOC119734374 isoform X2 [Patiria miniata]